MNPTRIPVACELFDQWQRLRGKRTSAATRPFSRRWTDLLESAGIVSAIDEREAIADAQALAKEGWIELKLVRYKNEIESVSIPLASEDRWCEAFGFVPPSDEEARQIREYAWGQDLSFVRDARLNLSFLELRQIDDFLKGRGMDCVLVPIKERSLQIFGDEKRLDQLLRSSALFGPERLTLVRLGCFQVSEPLPWAPGPNTGGPVLVLENAATWHSYRRWNAERGLFSAVVYGCGNRFVDSVGSLNDVFTALGRVRRVLYFGDLDPRGLAIPQEASSLTTAAGFPAIEPDLWSYRHLLAVGRPQALDGERIVSLSCEWLGELAGPARSLFDSGCRLAQEHIGWEFLSRQVRG